ncbi:hypothetical protein, partial [Thomasclavelia cocleata]|uniref:hypothetical protein n=1 Tax=Thomasclavelia cocleata TaxID=69824 RepID=UPI00272DE3DB
IFVLILLWAGFRQMLLTNFLTIHLLLNLLLTSLFYFYSVFSSAFLYVFGGRAQMKKNTGSRGAETD